VEVPFHNSETLHPKIVKQVLEAIEEASVEPIRPSSAAGLVRPTPRPSPSAPADPLTPRRGQMHGNGVYQDVSMPEPGITQVPKARIPARAAESAPQNAERDLRPANSPRNNAEQISGGPKLLPRTPVGSFPAPVALAG